MYKHITMSAQFGIVRTAGFFYRVPKAAFETDERLQDRSWYCAKTGKVDDVTISRSHIWSNEKYFSMKYNDGDRPESVGTICVESSS